MRIIVCGGRDYTDAVSVNEVLDRIHAEKHITHLWHGNARGADTLAAEWGSRQRNMSVNAVPADWKKHGKKAGPIRNQNMLGQNPALVVAFAGGRGTADMVRRARKAGVDVWEFT